tara:strand:+ start:194 stop:475 length:282 start_codon:yes stop_codon:yes gene_type:complete
MKVNLQMGAKTFACLVFENIFRSGRNTMDYAYGVNVDSIEMYTDFTSEIILNQDEAEKLYRKLEDLTPKLSLGLRNQMKKQMEQIKLHLGEAI